MPENAPGEIAEEKYVDSRRYRIQDIAKSEPLLICDSSVNNAGDVMTELYALHSYGQMSGTIAEAVRRATGALSDFIGVLREPNVKVTEEVSREIQRGLEILGEKQRYFNTATYQQGRHGRKDVDPNLCEGKRLVDALCTAWRSLATECRRARLPASEVCKASQDLILYMEDVMKLKANKPQYGDMKGRSHTDFRTDEKLLGAALGKALERQSSAIATKDADFCYMMPVYVGLLMCPELDEPWLAKRLREKPITLYKARHDDRTYVQIISTADIKPYLHFSADKIPAKENTLFMCNVKSHIRRIERLLGQQTPAA